MTNEDERYLADLLEELFKRIEALEKKWETFENGKRELEKSSSSDAI